MCLGISEAAGVWLVSPMYVFSGLYASSFILLKPPAQPKTDRAVYMFKNLVGVKDVSVAESIDI